MIKVETSSLRTILSEMKKRVLQQYVEIGHFRETHPEAHQKHSEFIKNNAFELDSLLRQLEKEINYETQETNI